ncbi:iron uptake system protein EfeO [Paenibacillus chartarius]|uniref:Iron uptake system protein EfeO n=1 Tax=Paenibacillus chartarius TaxID=747481 RepID=A0ABV6DKB0_9BACL
MIISKRRSVLTALACSSLLFTACSSAAPSASPAAGKESAPASTAAAPAAQAAELSSAIDQYRKFVISQSDEFVKATEAFTKAVKSGDMETAKKLYGPSRMYFERIEPIAESLGDFDPWIDAREGDVPAEEWRGFHRLEKALWETKSVAGQEKVADQLLQDVKQLRVKVESVEIDTSMLVTGAVELLNEVSSSKVTGEEERYSHTDLYDFAANVEGASQIFKVLKPALDQKNAALAKEIETRFNELDQTLSPFRKDKDFVLYTELTQDQVKKLSQAIDALAEPLSQMGTVVEG